MPRKPSPKKPAADPAPARLDETWMWNRAQELLEEANRLQRTFFQLGEPGAGGAGWTPPVDVFETATELWILVALPGVAPEHISVRLEGRVLVVAGHRALPTALRRASVHRLEIPHGRFVRRLELPSGCEFEVSQQELTHGCLALNLKRIG